MLSPLHSIFLQGHPGLGFHLRGRVTVSSTAFPPCAAPTVRDLGGGLRSQTALGPHQLLLSPSPGSSSPPLPKRGFKSLQKGLAWGTCPVVTCPLPPAHYAQSGPSGDIKQEGFSSPSYRGLLWGPGNLASPDDWVTPLPPGHSLAWAPLWPLVGQSQAPLPLCPHQHHLLPPQVSGAHGAHQPRCLGYP